MSVKMALCCLNTSCHYYRSLHEVFSSKSDRKNANFFVKIHVSDLLFPSRSAQVTGHGAK